jgi:TRAP-type C4-dicarboxylate transport system substrate-binding protein
MKKLFLVLVAIMLGSTLIIAGCAEPSPAPTPAPAPTPTPTPTPAPTPTPTPAPEEPEVITLRYASMDSDTSWTAEHSMRPWAEAVEKATNGRVKIEIYWSNTLSNPMDNWESVKSGIADAGVLAMPFWPGLAPLSNVISLPFLGIETAEQGSAVFWDLYEKYPSIREEFKDLHLMFEAVSAPAVLITSKQVKTLEDMEGMKFRVTGGPPTDYLKAIGASPMLVPMVDVYTNLQKGVIDGVLASWTSVQSMSFYEVADYVTNVPVYSTYAGRGMNLDVWNSLPSDIQDAINSVSGFDRSVLFGKTQFDDHTKVVKSELKELGQDMVEYTPPADELARWRDAAKPIWDQWLSDMEAAGHPEAQEILDTALELIETYRP